MLVNEIHPIIQGEGKNKGTPEIMLRLTGCPNKCTYCDTVYAQAEKGEEMSVESILQDIEKYNIRWVCVSGGEPLMQSDELGSLVHTLKQKGYKIEIQTSGYYPPPWWYREVDLWVVDYKSISSGSVSLAIHSWKSASVSCNMCLKFVVFNSKDLDFAVKNKIYDSINIISPVIFPGEIKETTDGILVKHTTLEWIRKVHLFAMKNNFMFSLQEHKIIFGNKRGV